MSRRRGRCLPAVGLLAAALLAGPAHAQPGPATPAETLLLDLCVDRQCSGVAVVLVRDGAIWVDREALLAAAVNLDGTEFETIDGRDYVQAERINHGAQVSLDRIALRLDITRRPESLPPQRASFRRERPPLTLAPGLTAFLNYAASAGREPASRGLFLDGAVARGTLSLRSTAQWLPDQGWARGLSRVDLDQPDRLRRWSLGDQPVLSPDPLGGGALIGGIGVQRAFDLDPFLLTFPQPFLSGVLETPGTVEIYANGVLVGRRPLQPGPFSLDGLGLSQGRNDLRLVLRDPFGGSRELSSASYYGSSSLLAPGLDEYALRVGLPRRALADDAYDATPVLAGFWRRGLSDWLTLGVRAEGGEALANGGLSGGLRLPLGEFSAALAASEAAGVSGHAQAFGYLFNTRQVGVSLGLRRFSHGYRTLGEDPQSPLPRPADERYASLGWTPPGRLSLQLNWVDSRYRAALTDRQRLGLDGTWRLHPRAQLVFGAARERAGGFQDTTLRLGLGFSLDRHSVNLGARHDGNGEGYDVGIHRGRSGETGTGYDLSLNRQNGRDFAFGRAEYQGEHGRYTLNAQHADGTADASLTVAGGLVAIGGRVHATRPVEGSFVLVRLPGLEGVEVRRENQPVGRTDARGDVLVPGLLPYYPVRIDYETGDVPVTWRTGELSRNVAAARNAGALVQFDATPLRALIGEVRLHDATGVRPVPGGLMTLRCGLQSLVVPVSSSGRFYLEDAPAGPCAVELRSGPTVARCEVDLPAAAGAGVRRLPPLDCPVREVAAP